MLATLPVEVVLYTLSKLWLQEIRALSSTSRHWKFFIDVNEESIYRNAAHLHGFILSRQDSLSAAKEIYKTSFLAGIDNWKKFCHACFQVERNWAGEGSSTLKTLTENDTQVYQYKVDEINGLIIIISDGGELQVIDSHNDEVIWSLPESYLRWYADFHYDHGFLVFSKIIGSVEVWRLCDGMENNIKPSISPPTFHQLYAASEAAEIYGPPRHGHFQPFSFFEVPEPCNTHFIILKHPETLVASPTAAGIWNIVTGQLLQVIDFPVDYSSLTGDRINDIGFNDSYIFFCLRNSVHFISRESGTLAHVLPVSTFVTMPCLRWQIAKNEDMLDRSHGKDRALSSQSMERTLEPLPKNTLFSQACIWNNSIAILLGSCGVLVINDLDALIKGSVPISEVSFCLHISEEPLNARSGSIHFDKGRIILGVESSIWIVTLESKAHPRRISGHPIPTTPFTLPTSVSRVNKAGIPDFVFQWTNRFQVTDTRLYFEGPPGVEGAWHADMGSTGQATVLSIDLRPAWVLETSV